MLEEKIFLLPLEVAIGLFLGLVIIVFLLMSLTKKAIKAAPKTEPNWSIPSIDSFGDDDSLFHTWDPRIKIIVLFVYCFIVVSLNTVSSSLVALVISFMAVVVSRLPLKRIIIRLRAMSGFLMMFLIILPLTSQQRPSESLLVIAEIEWLTFHSFGFFLALKVVLKACAVALMMEPIFATAPLSKTLYGLSRIGIPMPVCQMIILCHRYSHVFMNEMKRMYMGMRLRGLHNKAHITVFNTFGNFFGMLFVRSFDRTQRVYDAMICRGYDGSIRSSIHLKSTLTDWGKAGFWLFLGGLLLLIERM